MLTLQDVNFAAASAAHRLGAHYAPARAGKAVLESKGTDMLMGHLEDMNRKLAMSRLTKLAKLGAIIFAILIPLLGYQAFNSIVEKSALDRAQLKAVLIDQTELYGTPQASPLTEVWENHVVAIRFEGKLPDGAKGYARMFMKDGRAYDLDLLEITQQDIDQRTPYVRPLVFLDNIPDVDKHLWTLEVSMEIQLDKRHRRLDNVVLINKGRISP